jgi:hypothetical protein
LVLRERRLLSLQQASTLRVKFTLPLLLSLSANALQGSHILHRGLLSLPAKAAQECAIALPAHQPKLLACAKLLLPDLAVLVS